METSTQSTTTPKVLPSRPFYDAPIRSLAPIPPPTPSPIPSLAPVSPPTPPLPPTEPIMHNALQQSTCDTSAPITVTPWISNNGAIIIAVTIAIAITVEITAKFYFLRRKKIEYEKYIAEKLEELELEEDENFFKILKRRLGL